MIKRHYRKYASLLAIGTGIAVLGFNCGRFDTVGPNTDSHGINSQSASEAELPIGFLTAEQMLKTMVSVTGTEGLGELQDPADQLIANTYNERSGSLPSTSSLTQATAPTLLAATNLAASVCAKAVDRDRAISEGNRADRLFFVEMDFSLGLAGQSPDSVTLPFERIARNAWRRDVTTEELETVLDFASEYSTGVNTTDPTQTRLLAISICTAALSSLDALTY